MSSASGPAAKLGAVDHQNAEFVRHRDAVFERIWREQEANQKPRGPIEIMLTDGSKKEGVANQTSPLDIATAISPEFARRCVVAEVEFPGAEPQLWDLSRPLPQGCKLRLHKFLDENGEPNPKAQHVFWHSSAHILGQAVERLYNGKLTVGPAVEDGFYYDIDLSDSPFNSVSEKDYKAIEQKFHQIVKQKQPFQRIEMTKDQAREMFKFNKFKLRIVEENIPDGAVCTAYRCGPLVDLCRGPHIPNTGAAKSFLVTRNAGCYWKNDQKNPQLQRVYGVSFPDKSLMKDYKQMVEHAKRYGHVRVGEEQKLFFFDQMSPGSCFWEPHGARIFNKLISWLRSEYRNRGYTEVVTPNVYSLKLWEISGHATKYQDNMFLFDADQQQFGLKPMNCPGHCLMFKHRKHSYRDLPIRYVDFGVLHRKEASGALHGLTRVQRFQQDDGHLFCRMDQIEDEIFATLEFIKFVYDIFGLKLTFMLSTMPDNHLGEVETWQYAEAVLTRCLEKFVSKYDDINGFGIKDKDGAF